MRIPVPCTAIAALGAVGLVSGAYGQCPASGGGNLTQSPDTTIEVPNSIACGGGDTNGDGFTDTTQNGWSRAFADANEGVGTPITINSVTYGVQLATETGIPLAINFYLDADSTGGANTPGADAILVYSEPTTVDTVAGIGGCGPEDIDGDGMVGVTDLTAVILAWGACPGGCAEDIDGNENVGVTDLTAVILAWGACPAEPTYLVTLPLTTPFVWPAGCDLWIEVEQVENGQTTGYSFRPAGNSVPDCGPSHLRAAACGITNFEDLVNIGFPTANLILGAGYVGGGVGDCVEGSDCGDPGSGDCCVNNGTPGCDDLDCCEAVCASDPFCCDAVWDAGCAGLVLTLCAENFCVAAAPCVLASSGSTADDGNLTVGPDEFGAYEVGFEADWADQSYNPAGATPAGGGDFFSHVMYFDAANNERQRLTRMGAGLGVSDDDSVDIPITAPESCSDSSGDGNDDTKTSSFDIVGNNSGQILHVDLVQTIESGPGAVRVLRQEYTFTDDGSDTPGDHTFSLMAHADLDLPYGTPPPGLNIATDDSVGTTWNGSGLDTYVYQMDVGMPETAHNLAWEGIGTADYCGAKGSCDPDGAGPDPAMAFGTDNQEWDNFGLPASWRNQIGLIGPNVNGDTGTDPCGGNPDAHLSLEIEITVPEGGSVTVTLLRTYGAFTPAGR